MHLIALHFKDHSVAKTRHHYMPVVLVAELIAERLDFDVPIGFPERQPLRFPSW
jgi:hypothetical protein